MGRYCDIKLKKMRSFLKFLVGKAGISIRNGHHTWIVMIAGETRPYPIPTKHGVVNKNIAREFFSLLIKNNVCTEQEISNYFN